MITLEKWAREKKPSCFYLNFFYPNLSLEIWQNYRWFAHPKPWACLIPPLPQSGTLDGGDTHLDHICRSHIHTLACTSHHITSKRLRHQLIDIFMPYIYELWWLTVVWLVKCDSHLCYFPLHYVVCIVHKYMVVVNMCYININWLMMTWCVYYCGYRQSVRYLWPRFGSQNHIYDESWVF